MPGPSGTRNGNYKHGMRCTRQYTIWAHIKWRCDNSNCKDSQYYKGKGVTYPKKWETFEGFWEDMGPSYKDGLTIDREKSELPYSKSNCQWITHGENVAKDKRKILEVCDLEGNLVKIYKSARDAARDLGINVSQISRAANGKLSQTHGYKMRYA